MGHVGGLVGTAGGMLGSGVGGPQQSTVINPVSAGQTKKSYKDVQASMKEQRGLLGALQGQNGLQNQSDVYNQYQGMVNGTGPNPALAQLHNATAQNTANQAAMMASQRGSNQNAGMIARQAAMQGAANQQNSIGQSAALQAQQSQNALNSAAGIANNQVSNQIGQTNANTNAQQAEQANLFNAINGVNSTNSANQQNVNNVNGQLANTQMQGQQGLLGGLMSSAGSMMGMGKAQGGLIQHYDEGGDVEQPAAPVQDDIKQPDLAPAAPPQAAQANFGNFSSQVTPGNAPAVATPSFGADAGAAALAKGFGTSGGGGGGGGGMSSMLPMLMALADGGEIPAAGGPASKFGQFLSNVQSGGAPSVSTPSFSSANPGADALQKGFGKMQSPRSPSKSTDMAGGAGDAGGMPSRRDMLAAHGGKVPALVSPGEKYLSPDKVSAVKQGANPMAIGQTIPGKPKVGGAKNSYANDTVPASLDSGGIVLPRSVTQSKNPGAKAQAFVDAILAKKSLPKKK